jgi:hypothetical protein
LTHVSELLALFRNRYNSGRSAVIGGRDNQPVSSTWGVRIWITEARDASTGMVR